MRATAVPQTNLVIEIIVEMSWKKKAESGSYVRRYPV